MLLGVSGRASEGVSCRQRVGSECFLYSQRHHDIGLDGRRMALSPCSHQAAWNYKSSIGDEYKIALYRRRVTDRMGSHITETNSGSPGSCRPYRRYTFSWKYTSRTRLTFAQKTDAVCLFLFAAAVAQGWCTSNCDRITKNASKRSLRILSRHPEISLWRSHGWVKMSLKDESRWRHLLLFYTIRN